MKTTSSRALGFTLIEMLVVVVLIALGTVSLVRWYERDAQRGLEAQIAQHAREVAEAASAWAKDNYASIIAGTTVGGTAAYETDIDQLKADGYLAPTFSDLNPVGYAYSIGFRQPSAGAVSGLMVAFPTVASQRLGDLSLRRVARQMGAAGGYVEAVRPTGTPALQIDGSMGSWTANAGDWGWTSASLQPGSLAYSLFFSQAESTGDFVYRRQVPGRPELNRMEAPLNMGGNAITNVGEVAATRVTGNVILPASSASVGSVCTATDSSFVRGGPTGLMFCDGTRWRSITIN